MVKLYIINFTCNFKHGHLKFSIIYVRYINVLHVILSVGSETLVPGKRSDSSAMVDHENKIHILRGLKQLFR